ncbi:hypothetical protein BS78_03G264400 [Paspalum vaginatum]|nr:hypothetical protein BS78_03G264400 [Paspalum vaginatum]
MVKGQGEWFFLFFCILICSMNLKLLPGYRRDIPQPGIPTETARGRSNSILTSYYIFRKWERSFLREQCSWTAVCSSIIVSSRHAYRSTFLTQHVTFFFSS